MTTRHTVGMVALHLDVESLRAYLAVLDTGGMTRAAERLGMTQSAVSWKIKRLEERLGRPLLIRDGHAVRDGLASRYEPCTTGRVSMRPERLLEMLLRLLLRPLRRQLRPLQRLWPLRERRPGRPARRRARRHVQTDR